MHARPTQLLVARTPPVSVVRQRPAIPGKNPKTGQANFREIRIPGHSATVLRRFMTAFGSIHDGARTFRGHVIKQGYSRAGQCAHVSHGWSEGV